MQGNLRIEKKGTACLDTSGIVVGGAAGTQLPLVVTGSITVAVNGGCTLSFIEMPSVFSVDGEFLVTTTGSGVIGGVEINANAANNLKQQLLPMQIAGGFRILVVDSEGEIGDIAIHNVVALGAVMNEGAALAVTNGDGRVGNVRLVGAKHHGLSILGESGIALLQTGSSSTATNTAAAGPSADSIAYSGMVMVENVLTVAGAVSVATDANSGGFLAGLSLLPSQKNSSSFDVGGDITIALDGAYCREAGVRLSLPEEHQPRYQYGPRILFNNISAIAGTIRVESNGGSCLSDLELKACPAVKDPAIHGSVRILSASSSKSPGGINVVRADAFNSIGGDVIIRAQGAAQTIASIIRAHIDAKEIKGSVHVSTDTRGVIHNVEFWDNSKVSSGRLQRIQGNLAIDGTISTGVSIFGTPKFEVSGNVSITASGYRQGNFNPRGKVNIPLLSAVGGNLDVGHLRIVPEISINAADVEDRPQLHVQGSVRIGNAPTEYGIGVPTEGELWASDAEIFVGPTTVHGLVIVEGNLEIASNIAGSAVDPQSDGSIFIAGHSKTGGFGLDGALKMVAVKGSPLRAVNISGLQQVSALNADARRIFQVRSASFGSFWLNGVEVDSSQIPPKDKMGRDALCFTKCNGFGFVAGIRGSGCAERTCTCFDEQYGQFCAKRATPCTRTQFEAVPLTSLFDRVCTEAQLCNAGQKMVAPLQATSDRVCEACQPGHFQQKEGHAHSECKAWSLDCDISSTYELVSPSNINDRKCAAYTVCATNEIESTPPTATSDRACTPCQEGEFASAVSNTCLAINSCKPGFVEVSPPTAAKDRVCVECPIGKLANKEGSNCNAWATKCAAGMYESEPPSTSNDRQCAQCTYGTFQDDNSRETSYFSCQPWSPPCGEGFYEVTKPSRVADRKCNALPPCKIGYLQQSSNDPTVVNYTCIPWSACDKGTYAASTPSLSSDRVCSTCPPRSFQDLDDHTEPKCKLWTFENGASCPAGTYEKVAATSSSDRACSKCDVLLANGVNAASSIPAVCLAFFNNILPPAPEHTEESSSAKEPLAGKNAGMGLIAGCVLGSLILVVSLVLGLKRIRSSGEPKPGDKDFKVIMKETNFKINPHNYPTLARAGSRKTPSGGNTKYGDAQYRQPYTPSVPPRTPGRGSTMIGMNNASLSLNLSSMPGGAPSTDLYTYIRSPAKSPGTATAAGFTKELPQYETIDNLETSIYLEPTLQTPNAGFVDEEGMYDESTMAGRITSSFSPATITHQRNARPILDAESPISVSCPIHLFGTPGSGLRSASSNETAETSRTLPSLRRNVLNIVTDTSSSTTTPPTTPLQAGGVDRHPLFDVRRSTKVALIEGKPVFRTDLLAKKNATPLRTAFAVPGLGDDDTSTESSVNAQSPSIGPSRHAGLRSISISPTLSTASPPRKNSFENWQNAGFADEDGMYDMNTLDFVSPDASPRVSPEIARLAKTARTASVTSLV